MKITSNTLASGGALLLGLGVVGAIMFSSLKPASPGFQIPSRGATESRFAPVIYGNILFKNEVEEATKIQTQAVVLRCAAGKVLYEGREIPSNGLTATVNGLLDAKKVENVVTYFSQHSSLQASVSFLDAIRASRAQRVYVYEELDQSGIR